MDDRRVTAVLTSCGRFTLLEQTLRTFLAVNEAPLDRFILIEDSGDGAVREVAAAVDRGIEVLVNPRRMGQHASIDRAYALVETPLIMHLEDDWAFDRGGFVEDGRTILAAHPEVSVVSGRCLDNFDFPGPLPAVERLGGVAYRRVPRSQHPGWFGYSFAPGMRRLQEWRRFGPFARYGREWDLSWTMKRAGFRMAFLDEGRYREVGQGGGDQRASSDPHRPTPYMNRIGKSARKALFRIERALGRYDD
jgi:hypothetical protein